MNTEELIEMIRENVWDIVAERYKNGEIPADRLEMTIDSLADDICEHITDISKDMAEEIEAQYTPKTDTAFFKIPGGVVMLGGDSIEDLEKGMAMLRKMCGKE